jgi:hypothetical protein
MLPTQGKPLLLYISTNSIAMGELLAQHNENGEEREVY